MSAELIATPEYSLGELINSAANNPAIDADKLDRLLNMQIKMMDKQAEIDFNLAMADLRRDLPAVIRNKNNNQTNSKYADLDAVKKVVDPLLIKHGFYDRYEDDFPSPGIVKTTCEIVHKSGHSKKNSVQFDLDDKGIKGTVNKTAPHAAASSMTYGQRLSLCRALGIRISEDDDGNSAHKVITESEAAVLKDMAKRANVNESAFFKHMKFTSWEEIPANQFKRAENAIKAKEKANAAN